MARSGVVISLSLWVDHGRHSERHYIHSSTHRLRYSVLAFPLGSRIIGSMAAGGSTGAHLPAAPKRVFRYHFARGKCRCDFLLPSTTENPAIHSTARFSHPAFRNSGFSCGVRDTEGHPKNNRPLQIRGSVHDGCLRGTCGPRFPRLKIEVGYWFCLLAIWHMKLFPSSEFHRPRLFEGIYR